MKNFTDATNTLTAIMGLPHDTIAELEFVAFSLATRKPRRFA